MSNLRKILYGALTAALFISSVAFAGDDSEKATIHTAESAFETLISLEGDWKGDSLVVPVGKSKKDGTKSTTTVSYRVIANASSVMATFAAGKPMEMVSMYHLDGPTELIHTHYCAVGNAPTMRFKKTDDEGLIKFNFSKGTNMDVNKDGHVHAGTMKRTDENTLVTETELWRDGKLSAIRYATLHREK